jgi:hypothetical protein
MLRMVNLFIALSFGVQREQLEQLSSSHQRHSFMRPLFHEISATWENLPDRVDMSASVLVSSVGCALLDHVGGLK